MLDLDAAGLPEWLHPYTAAQADAASEKRLAAAMICYQLTLQNEYAAETSRMAERKLEKRIEYAHGTGMLLAALLKAEQVA